MAELVDAQDLGSCAPCIRVRVPSLAPESLPSGRDFFTGELQTKKGYDKMCNHFGVIGQNVLVKIYIMLVLRAEYGAY